MSNKHLEVLSFIVLLSPVNVRTYHLITPRALTHLEHSCEMAKLAFKARLCSFQTKLTVCYPADLGYWSIPFVI